MSKPTEVTVLCEDYRQSSLMLTYLRRRGIDRGIRPILSPKGEGSAEHWVVQQYPVQVNAYRLAKAKKHTWLIVVVDADTGTVARRLGQLDAGLRQAEDPRLREMDIASETIGRLVPRRNVETWILALNSATVNETEDYKHAKPNEEWPALVSSASLALYNWTRANAEAPENLIDSLRRGIHEIKHIFQMAR